MSNRDALTIHFDEDLFDELYVFLRSHPNVFRRCDFLILAEEAGGNVLKAALDKYSFPPCQGRDCADCWLNKWCEHKKIDDDRRFKLIAAEEILTTPNNKFSDDVIEFITSLDKTNREDIQTIFEIVFEDDDAIYFEKL